MSGLNILGKSGKSLRFNGKSLEEIKRQRALEKKQEHSWNYILNHRGCTWVWPVSPQTPFFLVCDKMCLLRWRVPEQVSNFVHFLHLALHLRAPCTSYEAVQLHYGHGWLPLRWPKWPSPRSPWLMLAPILTTASCGELAESRSSVSGGQAVLQLRACIS